MTDLKLTLAQHVREAGGPEAGDLAIVLTQLALAGKSFQRKKPEALKFLRTIMEIYAGTLK